ncbi:MAG: ROK family protein [Bacteroidetes bacterium]|nr:ROK family protein [Bacteroidota bacterium]
MQEKKAHYKKRIIRHLYFSGALSSTDLSLLTKKSVPLTNRILNELVKDGYVVETGLAISTGGRRPQTYSLKTNFKYIVAVAADQLVTRIVILDMQNKEIGKMRHVDIPLENNPHALEKMASSINNHILESGIPKKEFLGIGIGMPGFVDVVKGVNHSFLETKNDQSIVNILQEKINIPVWIDNDSSLIALAELKLGELKDIKNAMVINIGWGIGLGMIVNGDLFRGNNGFAGEFSHISIFENNKICRCGKSGCLETETSLLVLVEKAKEKLKEGRSSSLKMEGLSMEDAGGSIKTIIDAAIKGDRLAVELISEAGYNIGRGISILIHLFNPELIILSGRGALAGKLWLTPIQQAINEYCIPKISENTEIKVSSLRYQAEIIGAAALVMDGFSKGKEDIRAKTLLA